MNFFKENWKMLVIVLIVTVLFPIIILTPSRYGTISYDTGLTIVGYGGSILGGFLTLYGVWWTIKKQEEQKYKDTILINKPILVPEIVIYDKISLNNMTTIYFNILLKNIGQTEASNIKCDNRLSEIGLSSGDGPDPSIILPNTYSKTVNTASYIDNPQDMDFDIELRYSHGINKDIIYHSKYRVYFYNENFNTADKSSLDYFIALESFEVNQSNIQIR